MQAVPESLGWETDREQAAVTLATHHHHRYGYGSPSGGIPLEEAMDNKIGDKVTYLRYTGNGSKQLEKLLVEV